jgi:hypothetical protein
MRSTILCIVAVTAMGLLAPTQGTPSKEEAKRAEVLVLGVYHMANPGHDVFNMEALVCLVSSLHFRFHRFPQLRQGN